jgi:Ca2+-binding RTX toxin-like protein
MLENTKNIKINGYELALVSKNFNISYNGDYVSGGNSLYSNVSPITKDSEQTYFLNAVKTWQAVCNIGSKVVSDVVYNDNIINLTLTVGWADIVGATGTVDYSHYIANSITYAGLYFDRNSVNLNQNSDFYKYSFNIAVHEIGHFLGLDDVDTMNGGIYEEDFNYDNSIMSYSSKQGKFGDGYFANPNNMPITPMYSDINAVQAVYGKNENWNSKNTIYSFSENKKIDVQNVAQQGWQVKTGKGVESADQYTYEGGAVTLWDAGGENTITIDSSVSSGVEIILDFDHIPTDKSVVNDFIATNKLDDGNGHFTNWIGYIKAGDTVAMVAKGVTFKDIYGSKGDDIINGDETDNYIDGMGGNDVLAGFDGNDTIVGQSGDYLYGSWGKDTYLVSYNENGGLVTINNNDDEKDTYNFTSSDGQFIDVFISRSAAGVIGDEKIYLNSNLINGVFVTSYESTEEYNDYLARYAADHKGSTEGADTSAAFNGDSNNRYRVSYEVNVDSNQNYGITLNLSAPGLSIRFDGWKQGDYGIYVKGIGTPTNFAGGTTSAPSTKGTTSADSISGISGDDEVYAGGGNDTVSGNAGNDFLFGDSGADKLSGGDNNDYLSGGADNDTLIGGAGADSMAGGDGSNTFTYSAVSHSGIGVGFRDTIMNFDAQQDTIDVTELATALGGSISFLGTGAFNNTRSIRYETQGNNALVQIDTDANGTANMEILLQNFFGSLPSKAFTGASPLVNKQTGTSGNDSLTGSAENDSISGGGGNDTLIGDTGDDTLLGEGGNDLLSDYSGNDSLNAGDGDDLVYGSSGHNIIDGSNGNDGIFAYEGNDVIFGGAGIDTIFGGYGNDTINAGSGADYMEGDNSFDDEGADCYDYNQISDSGVGSTNRDTIYGFSHEEGDVIDVTDLKNAIGGQLAFIGSGAFNGTKAIRYTTDSYHKLIQIDTDGNNTADMEILLEYHSANITSNYFVGLSSSQQTTGGTSGADNLTGTAENDFLSGLAGNDSLYGNAWNDTLAGGADNDLLSGGSGNDTLNGDDGADILYGNDGDDSINGGIGNDTVWAGLGNDTIFGNDGNDLLNGEGGNDILRGETGADILTGNAGVDRFDYNSFSHSGVGSSNRDIITDFNISQADIIDFVDAVTAAGITLKYFGSANFSGINGLRYVVQGSDTLIQLDTNNDSTADFEILLQGFSGSLGLSQFVGVLANSTGLNGTSGADSLTGNSTEDSITGLAGNDTIYGSGGNDTVSGGTENDQISGGTGNDSIDAGDGTDTVYGDDGNDSVDGSSGNDAVYGGNGTDVLYGGDGNDTLSGNNDNDSIYGDAGNDYLYGNTGNDKLLGGSNNDSLSGSDGDDSLYGESGADTLTGNAGADRFDYNLASDAGVASGNRDIITDFDTTQFDSIDVQDLGISQGTTLFYLGTSSFSGTNGLRHSVTGSDTLIQLDTNSDSTVDMEILLQGFTGSLNLSNFFGLTSLINTVTGTSGHNNIGGTSGNDSLLGLAGNDSLYGYNGEDTLIGGDDNDLLSGGTGNDSLDGGEASDELYGEDGNDNINAGDGNNIISGGAGDDTIVAGIGLDTIYGNDGNDNIALGAGNDCLWGSNGNDVAKGQDGNDTLNGGNDDDSLYGDGGADSLLGDAGDDRLYGGNNNDSIFGADGNDALYGEAGADTLTGGNGMDRFDYNFVNHAGIGIANYDVITDFNSLQSDYIDFIDLAITAGVTLNYLGTASFNNINGLRYIVQGTDTLLQINVNGDNSADMEILLQGVSGTMNFSSFSGLVRATINGTSAAETINGTAAAELIYALDGNDLVYGGSNNDTIYGSAGADSLIGDLGNDLIFGGEGNDAIYGMDGVDTLTGDSGGDRFDYNFLSHSGVGNNNYDIITDFSIVSGDYIDFIDLAITAGVILNYLGSATFNGNNGLRYLVQGSDTLLQLNANGDNVADMEILLQGVTSTLTASQFSGLTITTINGTSAADTVNGTSAAELIYGLDGNDVLYGGANNDSIYGSTGTDSLFGDAGNDILSGGDANDAIYGMDGADTMSGGAGADRFDYNFVSHAGVGSINRDVITDFNPTESDTIDVYDLRLVLNNEPLLFGGTSFVTGYRSLKYGLQGNDTLIQIDTDANGTVNMEILLQGYNSALTSNYFIGALNPILGTLGSDTLTGTNYADFIKGDNGADSLSGIGSADSLEGGAGNDTIASGSGTDTLVGGTGADTFIFYTSNDSALGSTRDLIRDFSQGEGDKIDLSPFAGTFTFLGTASFTGGNQIRYTASGSDTVVQINTDADTNANFEIQLFGSITLISADFGL